MHLDLDDGAPFLGWHNCIAVTKRQIENPMRRRMATTTKTKVNSVEIIMLTIMRMRMRMMMETAMAKTR